MEGNILCFNHQVSHLVQYNISIEVLKLLNLLSFEFIE